MLYNVVKNKMAGKCDVNLVFDQLLESIRENYRVDSENWPQRFFDIFTRVIEKTKDKNYFIASLNWTHVIESLEQINSCHEQYNEYFNKDWSQIDNKNTKIAENNGIDLLNKDYTLPVDDELEDSAFNLSLKSVSRSSDINECKSPEYLITQNKTDSMLEEVYPIPIPNIVIFTFNASFLIFWKG